MKKIKLVLLCLILISGIYAQEVGIAPVKLWTNNNDINNPIGFGAYYSHPVGVINLKAEIIYAQNDRKYFGFIAGGFIHDPKDHIEENVSVNSTYRSFEFGIIYPKIFSYYKIDLNFGGGVSFDKFSSERTGSVSKKTVNIDENKFGVFYSLSVSKEKLFDLPVKIEVNFKHKTLMTGDYAIDGDNRFTEAIDVKELQLNLVYLF